MRNSVIDFLYDSVKRYPEKPCVADTGGEITFRQLFSRASCIAEYIKRGSEINQPILVYLPKSVSAIVSFAAILISGNIYVPLDIKSPQKRIQAILENIKFYRLLSTRGYENDLNDLGIEYKKIIFIEECADNGRCLTDDELIAMNRKITDRIIDIDPCYIIHTSGSTGIPKGVVIPHRGVIDYIEWAISCLKIDEKEIIGNQAPFYFDNSTLDIYLSWATGAKLEIIPEGLFLFPPRLIEYMEEHNISFIFFVPSVLISISKMKLLHPGRLPMLKKIIFAGEVMPTIHLAYWQENLPGRLYVNLYGPTEITVDCTYFIVERKYESHEDLPIGFPCRNSDILILKEDNSPAGMNEYGELCVRGTSLALGYWNDEKQTGKVFVQNPLQPNYFDRIYRTGDIVYKDEQGEIHFVGRKDSQIKHMGYRIELGEVEKAAKTIPHIDNCCVLYNEISQEITLCYEGISEIAVSELKISLARTLPGYMLPRKIYYKKELPLNSNGKIDRKALQDEYFQPLNSNGKIDRKALQDEYFQKRASAPYRLI